MPRELEGKRTAVIGLGPTGQAAAQLLRRQGADVLVIDSDETPALRDAARSLRRAGIAVRLGAAKPSPGRFDLALVAPDSPGNAELARALAQRNIPVISELELGASLARCLAVAITGTNGRSTTAALVAAMLGAAQRRTELCGGEFAPLSRLVERSRDLDYVIVAVDPRQLEHTVEFRPTVAVLLNVSPSWRGTYPGHDDYLRVLAKVFARQEPFDWAIVQSEALAQLRSARHPVPAKTVTFSARTRRADLFLDRTWLVSQLPEWSGPLLELAQTRLAAPHFAEDLLAALAVGRALKIPLETMIEAVRSFAPLPGRCQFVGEWAGVKCYDDHRAETPDATRQAVMGMPSAQPGEPNVWLIAGGRDEGADYYDLGPLLARRVKRAILLGASRDRLRAAWSLFTPCTDAGTLLEAVAVALQGAAPGDVVLWSPACFCRDPFPDPARAGEVYRDAILTLQTPANGGPLARDPTGRAKNGDGAAPSTNPAALGIDLPRGVEREPPGAQDSEQLSETSHSNHA